MSQRQYTAAELEALRLPKPDEHGEYATEQDAARVRAWQLRQVAIVNAGGDPIAELDSPRTK